MAAKEGKFGVIGVGRMGSGLAQLAIDKAMTVVGFSRGGVPAELKHAGLIEVTDSAESQPLTSKTPAK